MPGTSIDPTDRVRSERATATPPRVGGWVLERDDPDRIAYVNARDVVSETNGHGYAITRTTLALADDGTWRVDSEHVVTYLDVDRLRAEDAATAESLSDLVHPGTVPGDRAVTNPLRWPPTRWREPRRTAVTAFVSALDERFPTTESLVATRHVGTWRPVHWDGATFVWTRPESGDRVVLTDWGRSGSVGTGNGDPRAGRTWSALPSPYWIDSGARRTTDGGVTLFTSRRTAFDAVAQFLRDHRDG